MRRRSFVALTAAILFATAAVRPHTRANITGFAGSFVWVNPDPGFGGLSAVEMSPDGSRITALSDRGRLIAGQVDRAADGSIAAITTESLRALPRPAADGGADATFDTEGLAIAPDGTMFLSGETPARILRYDPDGRDPAVLTAPGEFGAMRANKSLESLAIDSGGALYTLPEETFRPDGAFPVYRYRNGVWDQPFLVAGKGTFLPVGADFGPEGQLYILERQFRGLGGFASRVRRSTGIMGGLAQDEVLIETPPGQFGNLEGISVWRDSQGALRLTLVSDDNFLSFLETEVAEFRVPD
jgi:hypothetical protein